MAHPDPNLWVHSWDEFIWVGVRLYNSLHLENGADY